MPFELDAFFYALLALAVGSWLALGRRHRFNGWRWWQVAAFLAGVAAAAAAVLSPLDSLGRRDLVTAHVAQHVILGDAAAPLLLIGLPPQARRWLRERLGRRSRDRRRAARALTWMLSPGGALVAWALAAYAWYAPAVHRLAVGGGVAHVLDHLSFLGFGLVIWLVVFDPRAPRPFRRALRDGGLPWWARHGYAMGSRAAMLPPALVLWFASGYHTTGGPPLGFSAAKDQANAASVLIGFEMVLFAFAFVVAFISLAVAEGRRQAAERPQVGRP